MVRVLVAAFVLFLSACASLPPATARPLPATEARLVRAAAREVDEGSTEVEKKLREGLALVPGSVDLARLLQNLRLARGEGWQVYEEARAALEAAPADPGRIYLFARVIPDPEIQIERFRECLEIDPSFYHASYGLAVILLARGDAEEAERFARRALAIRPGTPAARRILARALAARGSRRDAEILLAGLLLENPGDAVASLTAADLLAGEGRSAEAMSVLLAAIRKRPDRDDLLVRSWELLDGPGVGPEVAGPVVRLVSDLEAAGSLPGAAELLASRARLLVGDPAGALRAADRAIVSGVRPGAVRQDRLRAAILARSFQRAREILLEGLPPEVVADAGNARLPALRGLLDNLADAERSGPGPARLTALARSLSANGFASEAAAVARQAADLSRAGDDAGLADDLAAWRDFVDDVRSELTARYRTYARDGESASLEDLLHRLGEISTERLGRDVVSGLPVTSWPFVGAVARSDAAGAPTDFDEHGTLFVVGRRESGPVEATLLRLVGAWPDRVADGGRYDLVVGEGQTLRSYFEESLGRIAGFTLPGWILLNLDVVNRWEGEVRSMAMRAEERPLWPAPDRERRRSLWYPGGVRARLAKAYVERAGAGNGTFASSLAHERGHLRDARRYLPIGTSLPAVLGLLVSHGFSVTGIEETLERNAEEWALAVSPRPRNALLNTMSFLPYREVAPPHSPAYYEILRALVDEVATHPERYPSVDPGFNVLQQLDRLSDEELRAMIRRALDVDRPPSPAD